MAPSLSIKDILYKYQGRLVLLLLMKQLITNKASNKTISCLLRHCSKAAIIFDEHGALSRDNHEVLVG